MKTLYTFFIVTFLTINVAFSQSNPGNVFETWSASFKFHQFNDDHIFVFGTSDFETWTNSKGFVHFFDEGMSPYVDITAPEQQVLAADKSDSLNQSGSIVSEIKNGDEFKFSSYIKTNIYPNPAVDKLNIYIGLPTVSDIEITMFNSIGNIISHIELKDKKQISKTIDVENLHRGMYFLEIKSNGNKIIKKIILK